MLNTVTVKSDSEGENFNNDVISTTAITSSQEATSSSIQKARDIVSRYKSRGNILPRELRDHQNDPEREQEYRDAQKLNKWKQALSGKTGHTCSDELRDYLDKSMPNWRAEMRKNYADPLQKARDIVSRYKARGCILPRQFRSGNDPLRQQENKDARKLYDWKQALKGLRFYKCSDELRDYLDKEMPGWRNNVKEVHTNPMQKAIEIVERYRLNGCLLPRQYKNGTDPKRIQENKDAQKLYNWREALNGKRGKCSDAIRDFLDKEMYGWRSDSSIRNSSVSGSDSNSLAEVGCETVQSDFPLTCSTNSDDSSNAMTMTMEKTDGKRKRQSLNLNDIDDDIDEDENTRLLKQLKRDSELLLQFSSSSSANDSRV